MNEPIRELIALSPIGWVRSSRSEAIERLLGRDRSDDPSERAPV